MKWFREMAVDLLAIFVVMLFVALLLTALLPVGKDDTDPDSWVGRSGLELFTDAATGCQYVGGLFKITPRLGADGKQLCKGKQHV